MTLPPLAAPKRWVGQTPPYLQHRAAGVQSTLPTAWRHWERCHHCTASQQGVQWERHCSQQGTGQTLCWLQCREDCKQSALPATCYHWEPTRSLPHPSLTTTASPLCSPPRIPNALLEEVILDKPLFYGEYNCVCFYIYIYLKAHTIVFSTAH